jgi:hypothetical protein
VPIAITTVYGQNVLKARKIPADYFNHGLLDSGARQIILFGIEVARSTREMFTNAGSILVGTIQRSLLIDGHSFWQGDAVAVTRTAETEAAGLLPAAIFRRIYVCNSQGYVVFD